MFLSPIPTLLSSPSFFSAPAAVSINHARLPKSRADFDFIALGDNRPAGAYLPPTKVFRGLLKDVAIIAPTFVISSGDLIYGKEEPIAQFRVEVKQVKALLDQLPCPFFNAPGNHEISERPEFYTEYLKSFGPTYGSFKFGSFTFLQVSTEELGDAPGLSEAERKWLAAQLQVPGSKIAFQHHPVLARKSNPTPEVMNYADKVADMYTDGGVVAVFQGHDHAFDHREQAGVQYFLSGGAGAPLDAIPQDGGFFHFLLVHVKGAKLTADVIPYGAIEVTPTAKGVTVGNYADFDLPMGNVVATTKRKPVFATGKIYRGAKVTDVPVKILSVHKVAGGYSVRLNLLAPKHRATVITLGY